MKSLKGKLTEEELKFLHCMTCSSFTRCDSNNFSDTGCGSLQPIKIAAKKHGILKENPVEKAEKLLYNLISKCEISSENWHTLNQAIQYQKNN